MGHEQAGHRPAVIVADIKNTPIIIAIPLTKQLDTERFAYTYAISPTPENGLLEESVALIFQIRSLDRTRLVSKKGELNEYEICQLNLIIKDMLKL